MTIKPIALSPPPNVPLDKQHAALKKATEGFEAYFMHQILAEMRKTVPKDDLLKDDANQEEIFQDMMDQKVADTVSQRGDLGIGKILYNQLSPTLGDNKPTSLPDTKSDIKPTAKVDFHR